MPMTHQRSSDSALPSWLFPRGRCVCTSAHKDSERCSTRSHCPSVAKLTRVRWALGHSQREPELADVDDQCRHGRRTFPSSPAAAGRQEQRAPFHTMSTTAVRLPWRLSRDARERCEMPQVLWLTSHGLMQEALCARWTPVAAETCQAPGSLPAASSICPGSQRLRPSP